MCQCECCMKWIAVPRNKPTTINSLVSQNQATFQSSLYYLTGTFIRPVYAKRPCKQCNIAVIEGNGVLPKCVSTPTLEWHFLFPLISMRAMSLITAPTLTLGVNKTGHIPRFPRSWRARRHWRVRVWHTLVRELVSPARTQTVHPVPSTSGLYCSGLRPTLLKWAKIPNYIEYLCLRWHGNLFPEETKEGLFNVSDVLQKLVSVTFWLYPF